VPPGEVGELYLGGEQIARGYLNAPQLTRECFIPNPFAANRGRLYRTGDLVRWNECGDLEFLGRIDLQVQIGGNRVELEEVESVLSRHPDVIEACCAPIKDGVVARSLVAHIGSLKASAQLEGHLRDFLRAELPAYMIPSEFIFHTSLPQTYAGKIDRATLEARTPRPSPRHRLPSAQLFDDELLTLWRELLPAAGNDGKDKTFWESGGDSLKLIQLSLGVEDIMGRQLSLPAFLTDPTLRGLKNALEDAVVAWSEQPQDTSATKISKRERRSAVIPLREASGELPLYFIGPEPAIVRFAEMMDTGSSIFAVEAPLPVSRHAIASKNNATLPSIEQLASLFVIALSAHAQNAPFALAGHSTMGIVAFEVAHQLQRLGAQVELVILLDTWLKRPSKLYVYWEKLLDCWKQMPGRAQEERPLKLIGLRLRDTLLIFWSMLAKGTKKIFLMFNPDLGTVTTVLDEQGVPLEYGLIDRVYANAENAYHARILDCPGKLFVASSDDERVEREYDEFFGWRNLFSKGLEIVSVPGDHLSMIREKSCSLILANRMVDALRKFEAS
jgi:thioesterase domain-containing protein